MENIYFAKVKSDAVIPTKRKEDAGYDIYVCFEEEYRLIQPHETAIIPTGITSAFSSDYVLVLKERGSTGTKGMGQRCGIIDSGFRGEWFVAITNYNDKPILITKEEYTEPLKDDYIVYPYSKAVCQALLLPVPESQSVEISHEELISISSERGAGKLGSSEK